MELNCPGCQTRYRVADEKIPAGGARANCPHCGQLILIPPSPGGGEASGLLKGSSGADYGQTMAYDFSEVQQSQTEISSLLQKVSEREPFMGAATRYWLEDTGSGERHPIETAEVTLGRSGADLNLDDPEVSRRHCRIRIYGDRVVIVDLESTNGTFYQDRRVVTASLSAGERFRVGGITLELGMEPAEDRTGNEQE